MEDGNTIVLEEDRDLIYKARMLYEKVNNKKEQMRESYQKNIVDTGISSEIEEKIDKQTKNTKTAIKVAGTIATIALTICPADGPFGEIATLLATPAFCKLVEVAAEIKKKVLISVKRGSEKYIMHTSGENENVEEYDLNSGEYINDMKSFIQKLNEVKDGLGEQIKIEIILSFALEEYEKNYIAYTINDDDSLSSAIILISEIDTNTNKLKSIPFEEKDMVLQSYEELKKSLFEEIM